MDAPTRIKPALARNTFLLRLLFALFGLVASTAALASSIIVSASTGFYNTPATPSQSGTFTATFDASPSLSPSNAVIALSKGTQTAYAGLACIARFNTSGDIDAYNSTGYQAASVIPYSANLTYHFRMVVNVPANTYSVYVTPPGSSELLVGSNYGFRNAATSLDTWTIDVNATPGGSVTVSNLSVGIQQASAPAFSPAAGTYSSAQAVTITSATSGASIAYTTDGTTPTESGGTVTHGTALSNGGSVTIGVTTTLTAIAFETGYTDSATTSGNYTINIPQAAAPTFSPVAGTYTSAQTVTITSATSGASIRYTTDGSTPSETAGILYSSPVSISVTTTLKALAFKTSMTDSPVFSATYTIGPPSPVISSAGTAFGTIGAPFSYQITASNSPTSYGTTVLPAGLSVNPSTGLISGTPGVPGNYTVTLSATNNAGGTGTQTLALQIFIDWALVGAADFNKNGNSDLIWQNTVTGERAIWLMNGTTAVSSVSIATIPTEWDLVGAADFNGDGKPDLIWQDTVTGQRAIWLMNGTTPVSSVSLGSVSTDWGLVGAADFNKNGNSDLILQNTVTGQRAIWLMNGTTYVSTVNVATVPTEWDIVGAADFNGDGYPDLIWQDKVSGQRAVWLMNGTTYVSGVGLGSVSTDWNLVGAADLNGDGKPDLIWQDMVSRQYQFWLMNGTTTTSTLTFTLVPSQTAAPSFSLVAGTYTSPQTVTITSATSGASIRYTTDGVTTPTETVGTLYTGPVSISVTTTLKALAYKTGMTDSPVTSGLYTISLPVAAPIFNPPAGTYTSIQTVTITSATTGASIRYTTDGVTTPTETVGTLYTAPVPISVTTTLKVIAYKTGMADSPVTSGLYTINLLPAAAPTFSPASGMFTSVQSVTIASATNGALIAYTTDGSTPTESGGKITHGTALFNEGSVGINATSTLKAIAFEASYADSAVAAAAYTINIPLSMTTPTFSPVAGTYSSAQNVAITSATSGASIAYTTDGSIPTESGGSVTHGTLYSAPVSISSSATLNAIAFKPGYIDSPDASGQYAINPPPSVALTSPANNAVFAAPVALTLTATATSGDSTIKEVDFYQGATWLGNALASVTGQSSTYSLNLSSGLPAGQYTLTAVATDFLGVMNTSLPVNITVNAPPTVVLTSPANNAVFAASTALTLSASANYNCGTVSKMQFFNGSASLGLGTPVAGQPGTYRLTLSSGLSVGAYTLTAVATNALNGTTTSAPVSISVIIDQPPTIVPISSALTFSSSNNVSLSFNASDAGGTVARVGLYRNGALVSNPTISTSGSTWTLTETSTLLTGTYTYYAVAYDNQGVATPSTTVTVTVMASLPYLTDFENSKFSQGTSGDNEGYLLGSLNQQLGWSVPQGVALVTDQDSYSGFWSVVLQPGTPKTQIIQNFAPFVPPAGTPNIIFIDFYAKPVAETDITAATTFNVGSARFAFVLTGGQGVLEAFNGNGSGGGSWVTTSFITLLGQGNQSQNWIHLTARLDFQHHTWDLYAKGQMVAADQGFLDSTSTALTTFSVQGDATTASAIDHISAGPQNPLFADANNDGIDDAWETKYNLSLSVNDRYLNPSGNGSTVVQDYINGANPTDYYNGVLPVITSQVNPGGVPGPQGLVSVLVTNTSGTLLLNAPVAFAVTPGVSTISTTTTPGALTSVNVRTNSSGIAQAYVTFASLASDVLAVTAKSGSQTISLSVNINLATPSFAYTTGFEASEGYTLNSLNGQKGWSVSSGGTASVTNADFFSGLQSAIVQPGTTITQASFPTPAGENIVFADFYAKPVAEADLTKATTFNVGGVVRFAFLLSGSGTGTLQAFSGNGSSGGTWTPTKFTAPLAANNESQSWIHLTARLDFQHHTWDLYAKGQMVAADQGFLDNTRIALTTFSVQGDAATASGLDALSIGTANPLFADVNKDGIDDPWETAHNLSLSVNDRNLDPSGKGQPVVRDYINGTDPNDFYSGNPPVITPVNNGKPDAQGLISVTVTDSKGKPVVNAPVTFTLPAGVGGVSPTPGGATSKQLVVRTDANGVGRVYDQYPPSVPIAPVVTPTPDTSPASSTATNPASIFIDLGMNMEPIAIANNGMITLGLMGDSYKSSGDYDSLNRWRAGAVTTLHVPSAFYLYDNRYPDGGLLTARRPLINKNGWTEGYTGDNDGQGLNQESFIVVWPGDTDTPYPIKGQALNDSGIDESSGVPYSDSQSSASFLKMDNGNGIYAEIQEALSGSNEFDIQLYTDRTSHSLAFASTVELYDVAYVNSQHQTIGHDGHYDSSGYYFVGTQANKVDFSPIAINDAGQVLGATTPAGLGGLFKADFFSAHLLQSVKGSAASSPFVLTGSTRQYLQGVPSATGANLTGFDDEGNVYGAINANYTITPVNPGQQVIWVAKPTDWGLPASTPAYTPIPWEQPVLPDGYLSLYGVQPGARRIELGLAAKADGTTHGFALIPMGIAVDANRDGQIKFASQDSSDQTSATKPFRFWLNDDDDTTAGGTIGQETTPVVTSDNSKHQILTERNLEDFARLWLDMHALQSMLLAASQDPSVAKNTMQIGLKWQNFTGNPAINLYISADPKGSDSYLTDNQNTASQTQIAQDNNAIMDLHGKQTVDMNGTFVFPASTWSNLTPDNPIEHLLFEGAGEGTGQLTLVILDQNGNELGEGPSVWLKLENIKRMYVREKAQPENIEAPYNLQNGPFTGRSSYVDDPNGYPFDQPSDETSNCLIFVHGWNVSYDDYLGDSETMFKRLWWQGYKGHFVAFRWDTLTVGTLDAGQYNRSENRAFVYGAALKQLAADLSSTYTVNVAAHSMGNIVTAEALHEGMQIRNYLMLEAAIPASCYDPNAQTLQRLVDKDAQSPTPDWHVNPTTSETTLGYRGYVQNVSGTLTRFYNTLDWALATGFTLGVESNWEANQLSYKPDGVYVLTGWNYGYTPSNPLPQRAWLLNNFFNVSPPVFPSPPDGRYRLVNDSWEMKAFVARSRTKAVGSIGNIGGPIINSVDLQAVYGFGNTRPDHSGQFTRGIQQLNGLYQVFIQKITQ